MKSEEINYKRDNNKDIREKRATYGIYYPNEHIIFDSYDELKKIAIKENKDSIKLKILEKKITFNFIVKSIENYYFHKCSFYYKHNLILNKINRLTFRDCIFKSCFFGTIIFEKVIIKKCIFELCDFSNTEFRNCIIEKCTFINCSAENVLFNKTEIEPISFLNGVTFPEYNLGNCTNEFIEKLRYDWKSIRYRIASSIYQSNTEISHSRFSDISLYYLKKAELSYLFGLWKSKDLGEIDKRRFSKFKMALRASFIGINNFFTKGGTSISRLLLVAIILIVIFNFLIGFSAVNYGTYNMSYNSNIPGIIKFMENIPKTLSLFFSFGFSSFDTETILGSFYLIIVPITGLTWFAFLIPILLRRIYK